MTHATPSRRAVIRTAAWSVPAVTVATAAPAFAGSPPVTVPDMSTTLLPAPTRTASNISVPAFTLTNTGTADTVGILFTFELTGANINRISAAGLDANGFSGMTVTGYGTSIAVLTLPPNFFGRNAAAGGGTMSVPVALTLETNSSTPTTLETTVVAANGGGASEQTFTV